MGVVYAVVHAQIGKRAALKVLHRRIPDPERHAQRMLLEARVVNAIGHPNIVDVFDVGTLPDGRPYIVMERLEGAPLSDIFISRRRAIEILLDVCAALTAAHAAGVVHRDLKPENIFVGDDKVTLLDWGIARLLHTEQAADGRIVGTPQYLSPEQACGIDVSPASDVYALGVVAYELFAGEPPFEGVTAAEVMAMHLRMSPRPPELENPQLEGLILDMLAKEPSERPTIRDVARRFRACIAVDTMDEPFEAPRPRRWPVFAGAVALACSAAAFTMRDTHSPPAPSHNDTFVDDDGTRYDLFKRASTIAVNTAGKTTDLLQPNLAWEDGSVESPWMTKRAGYYYLFYRAANQLGVARATSPLGPFDKLTRPVGAPNEPLTFVNGWPRAAH
jgi:serine/threonine protein kinase